mmetsp:Transcript_40362/g.78571  ORF Transcript_40362/g.78571 Transcript_40362/m.78571 type:complete len:306 (+) Transcript_40362:503-1420(+)
MQDGKLNLNNAEKIWSAALDGPGITETEAFTIRYIQAKFTLTAGAQKFIRAALEDWEASASGPPTEKPASPHAASAGGWAVNRSMETRGTKYKKADPIRMKTEEEEKQEEAMKKAETMVVPEKYKEKLMKQAEMLNELDEGVLGLGAAHNIWNTARDGHEVTEKEFETLRHIVDAYEFTPAAKRYLSQLATVTKSGKSQYKVIDGKKYDRSCLDLANHLAKDGSINVKNAEALWPDILDGPGVTPTEANTIRFIMSKYRLTKGGRYYLRARLEDWECSASGPATDAPDQTVNPTAAAAGGWHIRS